MSATQIEDLRALAARAGLALVPLRLTSAMDQVFEHEGWQWPEVLAAAEAIDEKTYDQLQLHEPQGTKSEQPLLDAWNRGGWQKECADSDALLKHLGLDPEACRTEGGWLNLPRIKTLLADQSAEGQSNLEGLRDKLLHPESTARDQNGYYCNPAWPITDEDVHFGELAHAFGLELHAAWAESEMDADAYEAMTEAGHCRDWEPKSPEGEGWVLASIHDAEDGHVAWFVRRLEAKALTQRGERTVRFCPGCGSIGGVEAKFRDCCPDGSHARVIPGPLARHCRDLFQLALQSARPVDLVAILKALRLRARKFPRYSFISPSSGGVQRMKDRAGRWVEFDAVAKLLDETCADGLEMELHVVAASLTPAASAALAERLRQIEVEGWTAEHDDQHDPGELAAAAAAYALAAADQLHPLSHGDGNFTANPPSSWPWAPEWWKPGSDPRRMLEKALALGLAQMEQIDRQKAAIPPTADGAS